MLTAVSYRRSRSQTHGEKLDPEPSQTEQPTEEAKEDSDVPLPRHLPTDLDLLDYMRELQERIAQLPTTEEQIKELAR